MFGLMQRIRDKMAEVEDFSQEDHQGAAAAAALMRHAELTNDGAVEQLAKIIKPAIARPTANIVRLRDGEAERARSYAEVAKSVGFRPAQLILIEMYAFMESEGIAIFPYKKVAEYLTAKKPKEFENWCWRPLRRKDVVTGYNWGHVNGKPRDGFYNSDKWQCRPYEDLVPQHALEKVERIERHFGDDVVFFVSDFAEPDADPFIMCRPRPCHNGTGVRRYEIVFDVWDEPGFGK